MQTGEKKKREKRKRRSRHLCQLTKAPSLLFSLLVHSQ
jgi:hypothetical protein